MYAFIEGKLEEKGRDRVNILTPAGIGFEVFILQSERSSFPGTGEKLRLYTHQHVREDQLKLYGFLNRSTRDFFRDLLPQKGIGPKLGISILSDLGADEFRKAIHHQDTDVLTQVKGVGKKTAKRLIVEMGEKLPKPGEEDVQEDALFEEAVQALKGLGFSKQHAAGAVRKARENHDGSFELDELISESLTELEGS
ncbi:MAG: Holliday junction branch migration protein RuvA [bacterium]